jgi:ABC-type bacteriocin/lantibiotic exporter with double-glycine peptidase domain
MQGLKKAAESVHLKAEGVQVSREALPDQPLPSICWFHGDHYVCLLAMNGRGESGTALIHDPNEAQPKTVSQESLLQSSAGVLLTLRRWAR